MQKNLLRRLALIVAFALLTAAGAQAFQRIGASPIPVSLGLLAVFFTGAALPKKDALFSQVLYLLLVIAGLLCDRLSAGRGDRFAFGGTVRPGLLAVPFCNGRIAAGLFCTRVWAAAGGEWNGHSRGVFDGG